MLSSLPALKGSGAYLEDINHCLYLLHVHHWVWGLYGFIDKTAPINLPCKNASLGVTQVTSPCRQEPLARVF